MNFTRISILLMLLVLLSAKAQGQQKISWKDLRQVKFEEKYDQADATWKLMPTYQKQVEGLNDKSVEIKGYIIPLDVQGNLYALSAYPFSSCFFCGGAGPETVIMLQFKKRPPRYKVDDVVTITGILKTEMKSGEDFIYYLENVQPQ